MSHRASLFAEARRGPYGSGGSQLEVVVDPVHASSAIDTEITSLREKVSRLKKVRLTSDHKFLVPSVA